MASNPNPIIIPKNSILLVAANINIVTLHRLNTNSNYLYYYKLTGQAAPTGIDVPNFVKFFEDSNKELIRSDTLIDIYMYCQEGNGKIRVDEGIGGIPSSFPLVPIGEIDSPDDFPALTVRVDGWFYQILADVTDPYTSQVLLNGWNVYWLDTLWAVSGMEPVLAYSGAGGDITPIDTSAILKFQNNKTWLTDVMSGTGSQVFKIENDGNVGVGIDTGLTDKLTIDGSTKIKGTLILDEPTTDSYMSMGDPASGIVFGWNVFSETGSQAILRLNVHPDNGTPATLDSTLEIFRSTNTSGNVAMKVYKGDGTTTVNCALGGNVDSYVSIDSNNFGIGTDTPDEKLHVVGQSKQNGLITVADNVIFTDEEKLNFTTYFGANEACFGTIFVNGATGGILKFYRKSNNGIVFEYATEGLFSSTAEDGKVALYNESNVLTIYNRLGVSQYIAYEIHK